jgi:hypothetical protein
MKTQELKIEAPEGYEVDWDNSSNNVIRFKPVKKITYQDVKNELFADTKKCYLECAGDICSSRTIKYCNINTIMATSKNQIKQLLALNKLMNVAKYLNDDWEPDWKNKDQNKYCIGYDYLESTLRPYRWISSCHGGAWFKSIQLANQAIEILGEDEVKKALGIFE